MSGWATKPKVKGAGMEELIRAAEEKKNKKKNKKKTPAQKQNLFMGFTDNTTPAVIDYNYECGCFGTEHKPINNCLNCGRVICSREGQRPCPFCGTFVFSDETLNNPDYIDQAIEEMSARVTEQKWIPIAQRDLQKSKTIEKVDTHMIDLQADWFDSELVAIFEEGLEIERM